MHRFPRSPLLLAFVLVLAVAGLAGGAGADLVDLTVNQRPQLFDGLERAAARANQSAYDALAPLCSTGPGVNCTTAQFGVFSETRELVQTANELLGAGPTTFSLGLDEEGLGNALRWTAAEEVSAQSRSATDFSNGQLGSVKNRITALRYGARGFSLAGLEGVPTRRVPGIPPEASLGSAGLSETVSKLGGFLNGSFGWGTHDPTTFEDAFDYQSGDVTLGVDYRFRPELVGGLVVGYSNAKVDFDETKSIVDGNIESQGFSVGGFGIYTWSDVYVSAFASYQRMEFDIDRFITYPSLNPSVTGTDTRTKGDTASDAVSAALNAGYTWRFAVWEDAGKPWLLEPSFRAELTDIRIQGYDEKNISPTEYFALRVQEQDIQSLELSLGLRLSYAWSLPFGVVFPYARAEWRFETIDDTRETKSDYDGLSGTSGSISPFALKSAPIDKDYGVVTIGFQTILNAGRAMKLGGPITSRLSAFVEYRTVVQLEDIENHVLSAGLRYQF